jgi:hypothetical protein
VINGWFSTIDRIQSSRISAFGAERVFLVVSEFLSHLSPVA